MNETETPNRRLDLLGFFCPIPVHETRKALGEMQEGDVLEVRADDPETLFKTCLLLCNRIGVQLLDITEDAGEYRFLIKK